jgi:UDP-N-acetylmuramoyl-tripeptide--D-alanyl-D-alanine ligase
MTWTAERVARVLGTPAPIDGAFEGVSTDTRSIEPGDLFVALRGERFDAHAFLDDAVARGARAAIVQRGTASPDGLPVFPVADTLTALGLLARDRRREIAGPVVAVTGTNGKTATKEMLARVVGARWTVHATRANLNNLIGVPLTILEAPSDTTALVVEAGASVLGEVARLRTIVEPTIGVVTNVSAGHLEGFGSLDGVLQEKVRLLDGVALAVVGTVPERLATAARAAARRVLVAGTAATAEVRPTDWRLSTTGCAVFAFDGVEIRLPLPGRHQLENAMLALAVGRELEIPLEEMAEELAAVSVPSGRGGVIEAGGLMVIDDTYNANPGSVRASLETAAAMRGDRPLVVVLGTMLELGNDSPRLHAEIAEHVLGMQPHLVAVTGAFVDAFAPWASALGDRLIAGADPATLGERVAERLGGDELVLLKASRGVRLEQVIPFLVPE